MSELPPPGGHWRASDGNWYPAWSHPEAWRFYGPTDPPSATKAVVWTVLSAFWLWVLLPVAIYYSRKARREADSSNGRYVWSRSLLHRPVLLWLIVTGVAFVLLIALVAVGGYGDP